MVQASLTLSALALPLVALAQETAAPRGNFDFGHILGGVVATLVYGVIGILLVIGGFKAFSAVLPFSVKKELEEDHNVAVGILLAALVLGICIVVAATIHS